VKTFFPKLQTSYLFSTKTAGLFFRTREDGGPEHSSVVPSTLKKEKVLWATRPLHCFYGKRNFTALKFLGKSRFIYQKSKESP
jgi:hypothetical protein